jgi:hypothetical protein
MKNLFHFIAIVIMILAAPVSKADSYSNMMETLVFLGITDRPTVNHNIAVYQTILKSSEWHLTCPPKECGKRTPEHRGYFVLRNITELKKRIDKQMLYLSSDMVELLNPEINETLHQTRAALVKKDFKKALELTRKAKQELQGARL